MYRRGHPWVADHELSPKSVVRDMYERAMTFTEYVAFYGLARSEGAGAALPGRRLQGAAADRARGRQTEELDDLIEWLGELVRQVDSSLLDEWERLRNPATPPRRAAPARDRPAAARSPRNARAFRVLVRNALFRRVELAALRRWDELGELDGDAGWDADALARRRSTPYFDEHDAIGTGAGRPRPGAARSSTERAGDAGSVRQIFDDPAGDHDWGISAEVDLAASDEAGAAVVRITDVGDRP